MSNEEKLTVEKQECKCFCHSEGFRKFLVTAIGTFVGVYCALSLFAALHKPPMMMPCRFNHQGSGFPCKMIKHHPDGMRFHNFNKPDRTAAPFDVNRSDVRK